MSGIIAVDIGGTQIRAAVYPQQGITSTRVRRIATVSGEGSVFDRMAALIESVRLDETAEAVSVATAGPLDPETGIVIEAANIPGWKDFPLRDRLAERFGVPVFVGNDANLAALGEWKYGAGQGHNDLLYLTISTGIGGGVISHGRLLEGAHGMAAELGHVVVLPDGPLCSCGQRGHLEAIASGTAIARYVSEEIAGGRPSRLAGAANISAREAAGAAAQGDELAREAFQRAGKYLGQAVAGFLHIFNPSIVIFGGGVSLSGALLLDPVRASVQRLVMTPAYLDGLQIVLARLGDDAGLLGALAQARIKLSELSPTG
ncbi:MAG: glucokinase [Anaerolineaceae bacterium]|nr:MAG: glucokinase [Anaerolineaceae bacterium]